MSKLLRYFWTCQRHSTVFLTIYFLAKLPAYGLSSDAVKLIDSYLSDMSQQIRMGSNTSGWETLTKGVPQVLY